VILDEHTYDARTSATDEDGYTLTKACEAYAIRVSNLTFRYSNRAR
jgi:hypothetical protein